MKKAFAVAAVLFLAGCAPVFADALSTVALTIWGEARGSDYAAKYSVASVIYNRSNGDPSKMARVCLARKQFSCWRKGKFAQALPRSNNRADWAAWMDCVTLASLLVEGKFKPSTPAKHYHEKSIQPYWAASKPMLCMSGDHLFYK